MRARPLSVPQGVGVWLLFSLLGLVVYGPVLDGGFISDDFHYVADNEYVHTLSPGNLIAIWNPRSEVTVLVENYAPVHLMLHAMEWQLFGNGVRGYHVVNVLLHALAAALLLVVYRRSLIGLWAAVLAAAFFLLHPANVEAVAWISQIKSSSALVLSLGALLLHPRRPALALLLFALALFAKPFAAFALVVAVLFTWIRMSREGPSPGDQPLRNPRWAWLLAWLGVLLVYAVMESIAFSQSAALAPPLYSDLATRFMMIFSVILRYGWMALSGSGLSTFHEPMPSDGFADLWSVGGVLLLLALGGWLWVALRQRREEGVYLAWAAVSLAPLSGVLPLPYPMADRYLYFVLPGLMGAVLLAGPRLGAALAERLRLAEGWKVRARVVLMGAAVLLLIPYAQATRSRAPVFFSAESLMSDAELNYPNGVAANTRKASRAARSGDFEAAVAYLRAAHARGYNRVDHLLQDPYGPMQEHPGFVALKHEMAAGWIARLAAESDRSHYTARALAQAYIVVDDLPEAAAVLESSAARPGPIAEMLQQDAERIREMIARRKRLEAVRQRAVENLP